MKTVVCKPYYFSPAGKCEGSKCLSNTWHTCGVIARRDLDKYNTEQ